jgi:hypothetical protein
MEDKVGVFSERGAVYYLQRVLYKSREQSNAVATGHNSANGIAELNGMQLAKHVICIKISRWHRIPVISKTLRTFRCDLHDAGRCFLPPTKFLANRSGQLLGLVHPRRIRLKTGTLKHVSRVEIARDRPQRMACIQTQLHVRGSKSESQPRIY